MRKILLTILLVVGLTAPCFAGTLKLSEWLDKLPAFRQGVAYSLSDSEFQFISTLPIAEWKNISFELGYSPKDELIGVVSYPILKLKDLGVNVPILNLIECNIGGYVGVKRIGIGTENGESNNEATYGLSATLISIKF